MIDEKRAAHIESQVPMTRSMKASGPFISDMRSLGHFIFSLLIFDLIDPA